MKTKQAKRKELQKKLKKLLTRCRKRDKIYLADAQKGRQADKKKTAKNLDN